MGFTWFALTHAHQFIHGHSWSSPAWWKTVFAKDRFAAADIPDLTGKIAIVTGANKGIGYHTTLELAAHGCKVILACRSKERALEAIVNIKKELETRSIAVSDDQLEFLQLDLADMRQSHEAAHEFLAKGLPLHLLINNAGIGTERSGLIDGIECHMAVNHFGHFAFTLPLLDLLVQSQPSRIVIVSSIAHECSVKGGINFDRMNDPDLSDNHYAKYAQSKVANILFAKCLARRMEQHKVYVNPIHPGVVDTAIFDNIGSLTSPGFGKWFLKFNHKHGMTSAQGALTSLYCATSPDIEKDDIRDQYYIPVAHRFKPKKFLQNVELQEKLWDYSEKLLASRLAEDKAVGDKPTDDKPVDN